MKCQIFFAALYLLLFTLCKNITCYESQYVCGTKRKPMVFSKLISQCKKEESMNKYNLYYQKLHRENHTIL